MLSFAFYSADLKGKDIDFFLKKKIGKMVKLGFYLFIERCNLVVAGIYGAMAVAGSFICSITGIDSLGGFHLSLDAILEGLGYAAPPIMALLFILDVSSLLYTN